MISCVDQAGKPINTRGCFVKLVCDQYNQYMLLLIHDRYNEYMILLIHDRCNQYSQILNYDTHTRQQLVYK